jgi:hypothetical protein
MRCYTPCRQRRLFHAAFSSNSYSIGQQAQAQGCCLSARELPSPPSQRRCCSQMPESVVVMPPCLNCPLKAPADTSCHAALRFVSRSMVRCLLRLVLRRLAWVTVAGECTVPDHHPCVDGEAERRSHEFLDSLAGAGGAGPSRSFRRPRSARAAIRARSGLTPVHLLLTIFNCGSYWRGVRSSLGLARKPSRRPGWYCIRRSRVLTSAVS